MALLVTCALSACATNSAVSVVSTQPQPPIEDKGIPEAVSSLFYAVKDSLEYGQHDGAPVRRPQVTLEDYSRVTSQVLERFSKT